jgi:hypothetical protein
VDIKHKSKKYEDIIHLPRHVSPKRQPMPVRDRAAQFAPFSAMVGFNAAVKEVARLTEEKKELDEGQKALISDGLNAIEARLPDEVLVEIIYFQEDGAKAGGKSVVYIGHVKKIDLYLGCICMVDEFSIAIEDIYSIVLIK